MEKLFLKGGTPGKFFIDRNNRTFNAGTEGWLQMETTKIVPGNSTPNIERITSPEESFQRSGIRSGGDVKAGQPFGPSGSITAHSDGTITQIGTHGNKTTVNYR
ncbi:MAG: hypothetical protein LBK27_00475 [Treponema sp.]|nr:hypothetical protein [Treponema sp.]